MWVCSIARSHSFLVGTDCVVRIGRNVGEFKDCRSKLVPCTVENHCSCAKRSPIIGRFPSGPFQQVIEIPTNAKAEVIASLRWCHESLFTARLPTESPTPPRCLHRSPLTISKPAGRTKGYGAGRRR